jgi:hypothetical protein
MQLYVNFFRDSFPLLEDSPQGEAPVPVVLEDRAAKAIGSLLELESLEVSVALAAVFSAGVHHGQRSARGSQIAKRR